VLIVVVIASSAAVLVLLTDVPLFLVYAVWIAPVVVLIPYAVHRPRHAATSTSCGVGALAG